MTSLPGPTAGPHATALVLVDLQYDNVHPEGAHAATGAAAHAAEQHLVEHVQTLLTWARAHNVPVEAVSSRVLSVVFGQLFTGPDQWLPAVYADRTSTRGDKPPAQGAH